MKKFIVVENGNVKAKMYNGITHRIYYSKGNAVRADWEDEQKGTVNIVLQTGKMIIVSDGGVILRTI